MLETSLFKSNRTQAVRLPKDVAFPENVHRVAVIKQGKRRIIAPVELAWDDFFERPGITFADRDQPTPQERESF